MDVPRTLQQAIEYFSDADRCHSFAVAMRWPNGVTCPTCGQAEPRYISTRRLFECKAKHPKRQFSVKVGTIFEDSPIAIKSWLLTMWMVANCKNGVSSYEIKRAIGVTQKTAWFMLSRIRLAMQDKFGGKMDGHIEADETFIGGKARNMHFSKRQRLGITQGRSMAGKVAVFGLLERHGNDGISKVRVATIKNNKRRNLMPHVMDHVERGATIHTDSLPSYISLQTDFVHNVIDHAERYVDGNVHTNGLENFWSLLKRTIRGTYVNVEPFHLFRYLDEQAFRFNKRGGTDGTRFADALRGVLGRRLTYAELTAKEATA